MAGGANPLAQLFGPASTIQSTEWQASQQTVVLPWNITPSVPKILSPAAYRVGSAYVYCPIGNTGYVSLRTQRNTPGYTVDIAPGQGARIWTDGPTETFDLSQFSVAINDSAGQLAVDQTVYITIWQRLQSLTDSLKAPGMVHIALDAGAFSTRSNPFAVQPSPLISIQNQERLTVGTNCVAPAYTVPTFPKIMSLLVRNVSTAGQIIEFNNGPVGAANYGTGHPIYPLESLTIYPMAFKFCFVASAAAGSLSVTPMFTA